MRVEHNGDYALYFLAQSELLTGEPKAAREHFHELTAGAVLMRGAATARVLAQLARL